MPIESLLIGILAVWRISCVVYYEYGPWNIFERIRENAGVYFTDEDGNPTSFWGKQFKCFWCITFWVALLVWPILVCAEWVLLPFALSGGALLLSQGGRLIWRKMAED